MLREIGVEKSGRIPQPGRYLVDYIVSSLELLIDCMHSSTEKLVSFLSILLLLF